MLTQQSLELGIVYRDVLDPALNECHSSKLCGLGAPVSAEDEVVPGDHDRLAQAMLAETLS